MYLLLRRPPIHRYVILDQIVLGRGALTPIANTLIEREYGRNRECTADRYRVEILRGAGDGRDRMNTLG